jgi:peptidoglycan/xylan/chitin deacetylase (PgdA/CDA1 family)
MIDASGNAALIPTHEVNRPRFGLPIVLYHTILEAGCDTTAVSGVQFREHLSLYSDLGYCTTSHEKLIELLKSGGQPPPKTILIHFDDAYREVLSEAAPMMQEFAFTGMVFVPTNHIGRNNWWDYRVDRFLSHLSSHEIVELLRLGFEVGSHAKSHQNLLKLPMNELTTEISDSKAILESSFGVEIKTLSYPYGLHNERVKEAARNHYQLGFTVTQGTNDWTIDCFAVNRFPVQRDTSTSILRRYLASFITWDSDVISP